MERQGSWRGRNSKRMKEWMRTRTATRTDRAFRCLLSIGCTSTMHAPFIISKHCWTSLVLLVALVSSYSIVGARSIRRTHPVVITENLASEAIGVPSTQGTPAFGTLSFGARSGLISTSVSLAVVQALVDLYHATNGAQWTNNTNWLVGDPCQQQWHGVLCQGSNVVELYAARTTESRRPSAPHVPLTIDLGPSTPTQRLVLQPSHGNDTPIVCQLGRVNESVRMHECQLSISPHSMTHSPLAVKGSRQQLSSWHPTSSALHSHESSSLVCTGWGQGLYITPEALL